MKDRIAKSVFWIGSAKGIFQIVAFSCTVLVARLLDPSDFGLIALTGMWIGTLTLLAEMGLSGAVVQFKNLEEGELNFCFWLAFGTSMAGYCVLYAVAPFIEEWFDTPKLSQVLRVVSLTLPLTGLRIVPDSLLRKSLALDRVSQAEILALLVAMPVQVGLALAGAGVWALVAGIVTTHLLSTAAMFAFVDWRPGLRWGSSRFKEILKYSLATLGGRLCWGVYEQVDVFILGKLSGGVALGFYSMAKQIALIPVHKVSVVVNQLAAPVMAGLQHDAAQMRLVLLRQMRLVACLTMPLCVGLALVADDFVHVVLTDKWMPGVPALQILCLFSAWHSLIIMLPPVLFARYRAGYVFWWNASLLFTMPFAFWAGAAWKGAVGMCLVWITIYPLLTLALVREVVKELDLSWTIIGIQLRPIVIATIMMSCTVSFLRYSLPVGTSSLDEILRLATTCGIGSLIYVAMIYWQGKLLVSEIGEVVGWLLKRSRPKPAVIS